MQSLPTNSPRPGDGPTPNFNPANFNSAQLMTAVSQAVMAQLSPEEMLVLKDAEAAFTSHIRRGFWIGTFVGGAIAFRSRFAAGRAGLKAGQLPRLFFPSSKEGAGSLKEQLERAKKAAEEAGQQAGKQAAQDSMREGKGRFFAKAFGFGVVGSIAGTQFGSWTGRSAAESVLDKSGHRASINSAINRGLETAAKQLEQQGVLPAGAVMRMRPPFMKDMLGQDPKATAEKSGIDGVGYEEPGRELEHGALSDGVGYSDRAPPQDSFPGSLADPSIPSPSSSSSSSGGSTRWDDLRRSRAAPPSKWDELRQDRARSSIPPAGLSRNGEQVSGSDRAERELQEGRDEQAERERRRREFEALFEKEAKGGEDVEREETWR
ncbi:hypothetical protein JCM8097_007270 [Rhodosporidiobolus ruineniae]